MSTKTVNSPQKWKESSKDSSKSLKDCWVEDCALPLWWWELSKQLSMSQSSTPSREKESVLTESHKLPFLIINFNKMLLFPSLQGLWVSICFTIMLNQFIKILKDMKMTSFSLAAAQKPWSVGILTEVSQQWEKELEARDILEQTFMEKQLLGLMLAWQLKVTTESWWSRLSKIFFRFTWKILTSSTMDNSSKFLIKMTCTIWKPWVFWSKWSKNSNLTDWSTKWLPWKATVRAITIFSCLKPVMKFKNWL